LGGFQQIQWLTVIEANFKEQNMLFDLDLIKKVYSEMPHKIEQARKKLNRTVNCK